MLDVPPTYDVPPDVSGFVMTKIKAIDPWDDPRSLTTFQTFPRPFLSQPTADGSRRLSSLPNTSSSSSSDLSTDGAMEEEEDLSPRTQQVSISLGPDDRRFGFSVVGGSDEGFAPRIDTITTGSPADRADLEVGDEILEVNGRSLENCTHTEVIAHIHQCIRSRTICLRVKRKTGSKLALDLASNSNVQDAFVIAVEQQARERLEKLSALKKIQPVDMTQLSQELLQVEPELSTDFAVAQLNSSGNIHYQANGHHPNGSPNGTAVVNPIYVTSVPDIQNATLERAKRIKQLNNNNEDQFQNTEVGLEQPSTPDECQIPDQELELTQEITDEDLTPSHRSVCLESLPSSVERHPLDSNCCKVEVSVHRARDDTPSDLETPMESVVMVAPATHREMAVDVPDSFVAVSKTPPRYPPPSKTDGKKSGRNGTVMVSLHEPAVTRTLTKPGEPDIKPKVHVNGRTTAAVPTAVSKPANGTAVSVDTNRNIKDEQVERIRKYQEDIRKRKEEEERLAKEEEFLRSSLRGSKKLQALESSPTQSRSGVVNTAFQLEEGDPGSTSTLPLTRDSHSTANSRLLVGDVVDNGIEPPELRKIVGAPELLQSLLRIESQIRDLCPNNSNESSSSVKEPSVVSSELGTVEKLFRNTEFHKLLGVHNKVQEIWCFNCPPNPVCDDAEDLAQDVMNSLQECSLPEATELLDLLSKYEFEGLLYSHDKIAERQVVPAMTPDEELLDRASQYTEESVKIVRIDKTNEPLGATVRNEGEAVVIGRIVKGGAAEKSGLLHEGDEILEVNSIEMRGKSVNDVCDILATMTGTLTFLIIPSQFDKPKVPSKENMMHVKAHFDYDPDDDLYIPCRELGISFQKGDILHVINQDDPNWWQAYREGEEDQTLAGLIPSKCFQQQREAMKQTIVGDANNTKSKKGKFLCAKKHHKRKKKKLLYNANSEVDLEQILTYEEVAMYYPRANRKRPIVLIGPPNIGRHELRQRLMENTDRFAAAIPHTSRPRRDGEHDGVDYHFITRPQFEADILSGRFVEHGEYEKNYYGTSLNAIRSVVNSGKICVLNLHPQSLKILKNSDLKPYIVLVAPPSLEKLRLNRIKAGASAKDEELKEIIEKAREMEETFGHFFDMIIINSDIDKAYTELLKEINILEKEPQWVPSVWLLNEGN